MMMIITGIPEQTGNLFPLLKHKHKSFSPEECILTITPIIFKWIFNEY